MCGNCNVQLYYKSKKILKSIMRPVTREEEAIQNMEDITGEMYIPVPTNYCPMCGKKLDKNSKSTL